jgi:separase
MIREAGFFLEQALKTVKAVNASSRVSIAITLFGDLQVRSGEIDAGEDMLKAARELIGNGRGVLEFEVATGNLERLRGDLAEEGKAYQRAERYLEEVMSIDCIEKFGRFTEDHNDLVEK